ncbi:MAG TPA: isoprenylcysteine carboxylmethyltransferase family protein [Bacteroidota bacterium]|nr:isoprenylcysteine carboxylmethyltransferase family protein [Bacteroidota bacterium]
MTIIYNYLFQAMWFAYLIYWWAKSKNVKTTELIESAFSRRIRFMLIVCAAALLAFPRIPLSFLDMHFIPLGVVRFWIGCALTVSGLLFSIWARNHLGQNWSQAVTIKKDHELVTGGPYALVRHPIYTGLLLAFIGSALALGTLRGVLAVALIFVILWNKLRLEEKWMRAQFGKSYESYAQRVAALVPFVM